MSTSSEPEAEFAPVAAVIVLAAGGGTRMKSAKSKLLHEIAGRPLVGHAINAAEQLRSEHLVVVVGVMADQVEPALAQIAPNVQVVHQSDDAYGTGHAVRCAMDQLGDVAGEVVVTLGDAPLLTGSTLQRFVHQHRAEQNALTVLSARVPDPTGYGRIIRDSTGRVQRIVEHKDADAAERAVDEINSGLFVFDAAVLREGLSRLTTDNSQGEYYLTDLPAIAEAAGHRIGAYVTDDLWEVEGVNTRVQLAAVGKELNRRICEHWMLEGVTIVDPATTWIHADVDLAADVTLLPGTVLEGTTVVGADSVIGPDTTLTDVEVGEGATVCRTHGSLAVIGSGVTIGPYAYLRPGTVLDADAHIGTFVELKNSHVGPGAKVPHLTYAGDTEIGEGANIGAGTIFANYDGVNKHSSSVGRFSFVGSDSVLVAPVTVADGAYVAAGSVVTEDVGVGELGIARGRQHNSTGWVARNRAGSKTADAATAAEDQGTE
ncbi:bifunctional UDP-N-acetylglucosamine diphosphorylase/glucosamine-1-phosphate N-acetyltransferase GlmU [Microlunatus soli]|uniref:Bifunctional protein GlmU n=1 Tax=Microlunatus soli TaxID=630515 RepID=A0A1H1QYI9_9ACTN|nr:bifunctional UDP-N-acetylglucosamine diphosphorylase/glucosamine-1-phosphate N-acetyltransferase GlmU [Microlunatus soli]SDS28611.1 bifunctional UDP-N-acetylglucosamine pyrophosphorylase / Glucosamine-1-phosphate N-acetyltransferase [Microlunatus soli]